LDAAPQGRLSTGAISIMKQRACEVIDLGLCPFDEAHAFQKEVVQSKFEGADADTLIFVEHPPVITVGRGGRRENICASPRQLESIGMEVFETDRGGDVTYHGPGQIVCYPIVDLARHKQDVHWMLRRLEAALIASLESMGIIAGVRPGLTGVWVGEAKIAAIGIGVSRWITFHGFALNVAPDMAHFELIVPCGLKGLPVTCMRDLLGKTPEMSEIKREVVEQFCDIFGLKCPDA
jgi:lipoate-protein ligase B